MNRFLLAGFLLNVTVVVAAADYRYIRIPAKALTPELVESTGFNRDHVRDDVYAFGYVKTGRAIDVDDVVELDAWQWATVEHDPKTLRPVPRAQDDAGPYEEYHTYATLTAELKELAAKYPTLASLHSAGKSVENRELWYLRISGPDKTLTRPKLLYISSMHGDEVTGKEMMVYFIRDLLGRYGSDSRLTALVDNAELFIMPSMNPDGTEKRQRWNARGVDLNRDFPEMQEQEFSTHGRQPETVALMELQRQHHFTVSLNFHGGALCVNLPWDHKANPTHSRFGDDALMRHLATEYAKANGPMWQVSSGSFQNGITYGYEWFQILGGMQDWADYFRSSTHATLEISSTKWPSASQLPKFWSDNRESILKYFEGGIDGVHLKVTDVAGNLLRGVEVEVDSASRTQKFDGVVHRATVPGVQQVTVRAAGYKARTVAVTAEPFRGAYRTIPLDKL